jgi:hypothetical protein
MNEQKKLINVGIDFGTSGTKVIIRDIIGKKCWPLSFGHEMKDYPDYVLPSSVRVSDGRLYFGDKAEGMVKGVALRSFKICMACQGGLIESTHCRLSFDKAVYPSPKQFNLPTSGTTGVLVSPCEIGALYLAYVLKLVKKRVTDIAHESRNLSVTYNMSVPIDYVDYLAQTKHEDVFNNALYHALQLCDVVENGFEFQQAHEAYQAVAAKEEPRKQDMPTFVNPETAVAVFSYVLVDVGAGTTDISFFRLWTMGAERKLSIYCAKTHTIGANDIDLQVFEWLVKRGAIPSSFSAEKKNTVVQKLRLLKQRIESAGSQKMRTGEGVFEISLDEFSRISGAVAEDIFEKYRETWSAAYSKENKESRFRKFALFPIGGGSRVSSVRDRLAEPPWKRIQEVQIVELPRPEDLVDWHEGDSFDLLAVAYGLSFHPALYPDITFPSGVTPFRPEPPTKDLPPWWQYWEQD